MHLSTANETEIYKSVTSEQEFLCIGNGTQEFQHGDQEYCERAWDGISCWPSVAAGTIANVSCFAELNGVHYDVNSFANRECLPNGTWSSWSNYRSCKPLTLPDHDYIQVLWDTKDAATVYYVGYGISLIALTIALAVFFRFKELRCLRNSIHTNLMLTYFLIDVTWITTAILQSSSNATANTMACFLAILLTYLMGTNFFWMFVEGLYLFVLVVRTFSVDNVKVRSYALVGWGIPAIVASIWAFVKKEFPHTHHDPLSPHCPWQIRDNSDYIFICPVVLVLLVNIIFLLKVMWVLITKLRASNTMELQQYRKAAKALLVLIPLLGVTYILLIASPSGHTAEVIFTYVQAALLSIQGFIVAVLYCFLNGEVQNSVRHHFDRWRVRNAINRGQHAYFGIRNSTSHRSNHFRYGGRGVRDSCTSFTTSVSIVNIHSCSVRSPVEKTQIIGNGLKIMESEEKM